MTDLQGTLNQTREIIHAAFHYDFNKLHPGTEVQIKYLLADGMACLMHGLGHPNTNILLQHFNGIFQKQAGNFPGIRLDLPVTEAAFVYGYAIHVMDFEPMFDPPTHAVSPVLGTLLALLLNYPAPPGQKEDTFFRAFTFGIQLQASLRQAACQSDSGINNPQSFFPFQKMGFHPPGIVGVLGSALASAIWLGLTETETCTALGMAASRACGIASNIGSMTKATHSANAARAGLECVLLAQKGFTAANATFDQEGGWTAVFGGNGFNLQTLLQGMYSLSCFTAPGFAFKKWPVHTAMQIAIDAALKLYSSEKPTHVNITIEAPVLRYCDRPFPESGDECRFSFQYNVVQSFLYGVCNESSFNHDRLLNPAVQDLLNRTTLLMRQDIPSGFPEMEVIITLSDGRSAKSESWPGHWKSPATEDQIKEKLRAASKKMPAFSEPETLWHLIFSSGKFPDPEKWKLVLKSSSREA